LGSWREKLSRSIRLNYARRGSVVKDALNFYQPVFRKRERCAFISFDRGTTCAAGVQPSIGFLGVTQLWTDRGERASRLPNGSRPDTTWPVTEHPWSRAMVNLTPEQAFSDVMVGVVDTLEVICRQLIERGYLNSELLISDLDEMQDDLRARNVGEFGRGIPAGLVAVLREANSRTSP
jgi:hypothetical protein